MYLTQENIQKDNANIERVYETLPLPTFPVNSYTYVSIHGYLKNKNEMIELID